MTNPITAGTPIINISLIDQSKVLENCSLFSLANRLDNLGKITVAIAIAKIPKGSCIKRSETYSQLGLPVGNKDAKIVSTSIFIWLTPPAIMPGTIKNITFLTPGAKTF